MSGESVSQPATVDPESLDEVLGAERVDRQRSWLSRAARLAANPGRLLNYLQRKRGYRQAWDQFGADQERAYIMVDTSRDEQELTRRGRAVARLLVDAMQIEPDHTVLEIGCGPARIGREMAPLCGHWTGCDISKKMLQRARGRTQQLDNVSFEQLKGADLSMFQDDQFDRVYCHSVLVHIDKEDMFRYLCEIKRVLKRGGVAYVDTWDIRHPSSWRWFMGTVESGPLAGRKEAWRPQFATTQELDCLIQHAGLTPILVHDKSHLLQAFVTTGSDGEAQRAAAALREKISPLLTSIEGID